MISNFKIITITGKGRSVETVFFRLLNKLIKTEYHRVVSRKNTPLFTSLLRTGAVLRARDLPFDNSLKHQLDLDSDVYTDQESYKSLQNAMIDTCKSSKTFLSRFYKRVEFDCRRYLAETRKIGKRNVDKADNKKLLSLFQTFIEQSHHIVGYLYPPLAIEDWLMEKIKSEMKKYIKIDAISLNNDLQTLIRPLQLSELQKRKEAILKLAIKIANNRKLSKEIINNHFENIKIASLKREIQRVYEQYAWLRDHYMNLHYETLHHFYKELRNTIPQNPQATFSQIVKERTRFIVEKKKIIIRYHFGKRLIILLQQASSLPYIRLLRLEVILKSAYYLQNVFNGISRRINANYLPHMYYFEILDALRGKKIDRKLMNARAKGFGLAVIRHTIYCLDKEKARLIRDKIEGTFAKESILRGNTACRGKVKGIVRVIFSSKENYKVKKGNILITSMTTPDFVPAMEKAAAFVTDEGGISCHAAIVAREMNKPCVIGTRIATKIFKDGDRVEVDAMKGVVYKL